MSYRAAPESFGFLITDLSRLIRVEFDRRVASSGLGITAGEARTLVHVARNEGERQNVIAERMGIEAMTLSGFIDRLEARELVVRETDPSDRRAKKIFTTESSGEALAAIYELASSLRDQALEGVAPPEREVLFEMLRHARGNLLAMKAASCGREIDAA